MTRQAIYDAVTNWMQPPNVIGLNKVVSGAPVIMDGASFRLNEQSGWGAYGFTHIQHATSKILAFGGIRQNTYEVVFMMLFQQVVKNGYDLSADPAFYQPNLTKLLDGALARLKLDHTLGTGTAPNGVGGITITKAGALFQAGVGDGQDGSPDLIVESDIPRRSEGSGKIWSWHHILFQAIEMEQL